MTDEGHAAIAISAAGIASTVRHSPTPRWPRALLLALMLSALAMLLGACAAAPLPLALHFTKPVVLLGEVHDNAAQHALRLRAVEDWLRAGARPALLMEQFDRDRQAAIDQVLAQPEGAVDADALIDAGAPGRKGWDWAFYRPFVALALRYRLPIVAANVGREEARAVIRDGLVVHGFYADVPPPVLAALAADLQASHCGHVDAALAGRMVRAQVARDQFMARAVEAWAGRGALLLAGNGHVRRLGVPQWLSPATRVRTEAIGMLEAGDGSAADYDRVVFTAAQPRADPCEGLRALPR